MENLQKLLLFLSPLPTWLRVIIAAVVAAIMSVCLSLTVSSCGQVLKVTVRDTPNGVTISTSQNKSDSTATNINITPNINLHGTR